MKVPKWQESDEHGNEWKNEQALSLGVHSLFLNMKITFYNIKTNLNNQKGCFRNHGNLGLWNLKLTKNLNVNWQNRQFLKKI